MWLELIKIAKHAYCIQDSLAYYRLSHDTLSSNKWKASRWQWNIYRHHHDDQDAGEEQVFHLEIVHREPVAHAGADKERHDRLQDGDPYAVFKPDHVIGFAGEQELVVVKRHDGQVPTNVEAIAQQLLAGLEGRQRDRVEREQSDNGHHREQDEQKRRRPRKAKSAFSRSSVFFDAPLRSILLFKQPKEPELD